MGGEWDAFRLIDLSIIVVYLAVMVGIGLSLANRTRKTEAFLAASRSLPGWAVGLSIFGTFVSSISFLANPGKSYDTNWNFFVFGLSLPIAAWIAARYFIPFYRRSGTISAYTHLEERFGVWARLYAVGCYLLTQVARVGTILYLVSLAVTPMFPGIETWVLIVIIGTLVTIYTLTGGIEAVIWTDVIQSVVLTVGMIICLGVLLWRMPEGPTQIFSIAHEHGKLSLGEMSLFSDVASMFWIVLIYGLVINLQNFGIDQTYVQRYATAKDDDAAKRSVWIGALLYLPISAILFFIGTALFAYYTASPDLFRPEKADEIFPHFINNELSVGVRGLMIAAILAAAMSSVDSSLNSSAALVLCDLYRRFLGRSTSERESMRVLYGSTIFWGIIGTFAALAMIHVESALKHWWTLAGIFGGGMLGLFLLGRICSRAGSKAALTGVATGVLVILWASLCHPDSFVWKWLWEHLSEEGHRWLLRLQNPLSPLVTIVLGTVTILLVGTLASTIWPRQDKASQSAVV